MVRLLRRNFLILLLLLILIVYLQYLLLQPVLNLGINHDDWVMLDSFRILGPNLLSQISNVIERWGPHYIQAYWIGILVNIFGLYDPSILRIPMISLKVVETLMIYPVVLLIFKRRLLAFLSTSIYAMHYSATGTLEHIISGPDYLVGLFLLFFLAIYYKNIKNKTLNLKWLCLLLLSLIATIFFQPVRAYPLLTLPFFIESALFLYDHSKSSLRNSFFRLLTLSPVYLLIFIVFVFSKGTLEVGNVTPHLLSYILRGDWYFTLHPFAALSNLFLPLDYLHKVFGVEVFNPNNIFLGYLLFLIRKSFIFFGLLTYFFSFFIKPYWLSRWRFILITLILNFMLEIGVFFIYNLRNDNLANYQNPSELGGMYPVFFGTFLLILNFWAIYGWWKGGKKNNLLWAFWSGLTFSFIFLVFTRLMADEIFAYQAYHRYLLTASLGASLCFASLLTLFYDKVTSTPSELSRSFSGILISLMLIVFYYISNLQISYYFNGQLDNGKSAQVQKDMRQKFLEKFSKYKYDDWKSSFFNFDVSGESSHNSLFFENSFSNSFMYWMHSRNQKLVDGCIQNRVGTIDSLKEFVKIKNGVKGIDYLAYCINVKDGTYDSHVPIFFTPENFYSFKIKGREFIDIRDESLKELGLNY